MNIYQSKLFKLNGEIEEMELGLEQAFNKIHQGNFDVILAKVESEDSVDHWWGKHESLELNPHEYHHGVTTCGMPLGKLQRANEEEYPSKVNMYFESATVVNEGLRKTKFYNFIEQELKTKPMKLEDGKEMLISTQREFPPSDEITFSFAPHCDSIAFCRARNSWPIKEVYVQTAAFITVQVASNSAGFMMWNYAPKSRMELDKFLNMYGDDKEEGMDFLNQYSNMVVHPKAGELCIFNCRNMHGIQTCDTPRRTIGSFFIEKDGWRMFN